MVAKEQKNFGLKYAGEYLCIDTEEVQDWIDDNIPLDDARWRVRGRNRPGRNSGLTFLLDPEPTRPIKLNHLYYPNTACKWAEFFFIATRKELRKIEVKCFPQVASRPQTLEMWSQEDRKVSVSNMYLLPPRPIGNEMGTKNPVREGDLYLCCLVDDRYYWKDKTTGQQTMNENTQWSTLINGLASSMGISLSLASIDSAYTATTASHNSELYDCYQEGNAAQFLDACLYNVGQRLYRKLDGTYATKTFTSITSNTNWKKVDEKKDLRIGQDSFTTGRYKSNDYRTNAQLPENVKVTFPVYVDTIGDYYLRQNYHLRSPLSSGYIWTETVSTDDVISGMYGVEGTTKVLHDTAPAYFCTLPVSGNPENKTAIRNLAVRAASDYLYAQTKVGADIVLNGVFNWTPDGSTDIVWEFSRNDCCTRLVAPPYNWSYEELHHHLPNPCQPSSSSESSSQPSSQSSSKPSSMSSKSSQSSSKPSSMSSQSYSSSQKSSMSSSQESPSACDLTEDITVLTAVKRSGDYAVFDRKTMVFRGGLLCEINPETDTNIYLCCDSSFSSASQSSSKSSSQASSTPSSQSSSQKSSMSSSQKSSMSSSQKSSMSSSVKSSMSSSQKSSMSSSQKSSMSPSRSSSQKSSMSPSRSSSQKSSFSSSQKSSFSSSQQSSMSSRANCCPDGLPDSYLVSVTGVLNSSDTASATPQPSSSVGPGPQCHGINTLHSVPIYNGFLNPPNSWWWESTTGCHDTVDGWHVGVFLTCNGDGTRTIGVEMTLCVDGSGTESAEWERTVDDDVNCCASLWGGFSLVADNTTCGVSGATISLIPSCGS